MDGQIETKSEIQILELRAGEKAQRLKVRTILVLDLT